MAGMNVRDDILNKIEKPKPSGRDLAYRAVAAVFGGPVDLTSMVMRPFGYDVEKPVLGSEWIGQKMENVGLVSEARDPLQEFMASLLVPGGGIEAVPALAGKGMAMLPAALGVVKAKGGNWLTGSVEETLEPLKRRWPLGSPVRERGEALNSWIKGPLTKYVKTRMASPDDEIRKLADQGVLHFDPGAEFTVADMARRQAGMPEGNTALTGLGKSWEDAADTSVLPQTVGELLRGPKDVNPAVAKAHRDRALQNDPWLAKVPLETPAYQVPPYGTSGKLGFRHLTDELSNALNPESGLPRALQLSPDQMKNLSVEKAVRRVADINKWRANQMAEANKAIAFDEKTAPIFKEYQTVPGHGNGQPNEKGLHWREIKAPEKTGKVVTGGERSDPRFQVPEDIQDRFQTQAYDEALQRGIDEESDGMMEYVEGRMQELTTDWSARNPKKVDESYAALEKQLKYEGDTMGHCVGGYCDAVSSGERQVYTLRDKTGKPHVTIEVQPGKLSGKTSLADWAASYERTHGEGTSPAFLADHPEIAEAFMPSVKQIKGAKNSAPKDEYVPFIQDFIRNGNFSDVGDLKNAQLKRASQTFNKTELAYLEKHGAKLTGEEYLTNAEVEALQSLFKSTNK